MSDAPPAQPSAIASRLLRSRVLLFDLATSYLLSIVRAGSMFAIVALLSRRTTAGYLAAFLFLRAMLGILNNTFAGAQASAVAALRDRTKPLTDVEAEPLIDESGTVESASIPKFSYESKVTVTERYRTKGFDGLFLAAAGTAIVAYLIVELCAPALLRSAAPLLPASRVPAIYTFAIAFTIGLLGRLGSDSAGGVLQTRRLLWLDNLLVIAAEVGWVAIVTSIDTTNWQGQFEGVALSYSATGIVLFILRWLIAGALLIDFKNFTFSIRFVVAARFLASSALLAFASLGDFLYGPANSLIITRYLDPLLIADYGPALQIDALLLLGVQALASVVFPRAATLYDRGEYARLRHAYLLANYSASLLLITGAAIVMLFRDSLLHLWLGEVRPGTAAIVPFVLMHTVLGGNAGISRSVLLGMGKFRAYTLFALGGGLANVILALLFVRLFGWGLRSIAIATTISVFLRAGVVMPWYILRTLRGSVPSQSVPSPGTPGEG